MISVLKPVRKYYREINKIEIGGDKYKDYCWGMSSKGCTFLEKYNL